MAPVEDVQLPSSTTTAKSWEKEFIHKSCQSGKDADKQRCVRCLFEKHEKELVALKEKLGDSLKEPCVDDLWLLRFVLSHVGNTDEAVEAVKSTLAWRKEHTPLVKSAREHQPAPKDNIIRPFMVGGVHEVMADETTILFIIRVGVSDIKGLIVHAKITEEELFLWLLHQRESLYMKCDKATRESGLLVKSTTVFDLSHLSVKKMLLEGKPPAAFEKAMSRASKLGEDMYPQLVDKTMFVNTPAIFSLFFAFFKKMANKKLLEKVVQTNHVVHDPANPHPHTFEASVIPTFVGGTCSCKGGCVPGVSNDMKEPHPRK
eukprot:comp11950_c0_seq1/m.6625 comp11950_c0_seq1/g.6625  ORF comp11950_c0_seq1/g.6625 comp11950_c0_seq1/m.6625 type:complete len:317 (-) comp11950_c0_seq1:32-982(-)